MAYAWDSVVAFGKYKGMTIGDIASFNPEYISWASRELEAFDLTEEAKQLWLPILRKHRRVAQGRVDGWAWGFGRAARSNARLWQRDATKTKLDIRRTKGLQP